MEKITYTEIDNEVLIEDELTEYIKDHLAPTTSDLIFRIIKTMDLFGYGDYSLDLYNFINISKINIDPDEEKLLFISLVISHAIKLIEGIGLIVKDDIVNEDYFQYLKFFTLTLESLWLLRNMTNIDAIYFSDLINNDNLRELEIIYRILEYYSKDIDYNTFFYLIGDYKESFYTIITSKVNDLAVMDIEDDITELDADDLVKLSSIINKLSNKYKNSIILAYLTVSITDFKYLIRNKEFVKEIELTSKVKLDSLINGNNSNNYYMFLDTNEEIINIVFDMFMINFLDDMVNNDESVVNALTYAFDSVKDIFYDNEYKGISGLMKVLNNINKDLEDMLSDKTFRDNLIEFVKGNEDV